MEDEVVIYQFRTSYYSQMVRLAAVEKGIPFKRVDINIASGENYSPDYLRINPACEVPAITHHGKTLSGSQNIISYFDIISTNVKPPADKQAEIEEFRMECCDLPMAEISMGVCLNPNQWEDAKVPQQISEIFSKRVNRVAVLEANIVKYPELAEAYREKLTRVVNTESQANDVHTVHSLLKGLESFLDRANKSLRAHVEQEGASYNGWLFGAEFTNADIALATLLARMDFLGFAGRLWDNTERVYLADYYRRLKERPSFKQECIHSL